MGRDTNTGHTGRGGNSGRDGRGKGGCGKGANATVPRKASEVGACKDLERHIFTVGWQRWGYAQNLNGENGYLHWYQVWQ